MFFHGYSTAAIIFECFILLIIILFEIYCICCQSSDGSMKKSNDVFAYLHLVEPDKCLKSTPEKRRIL